MLSNNYYIIKKLSSDHTITLFLTNLKVRRWRLRDVKLRNRLQLLQALPVSKLMRNCKVVSRNQYFNDGLFT